MKKSLNWILFTMLFLFHITVMSSCDNGCVQGQIRECSCPNGVQKEQICLSYKGDWEKCPCEGEDTKPTDSDTGTAVDTGEDAGTTDEDAGADSDSENDTEDTEKATETDSAVDSEEETDSADDSETEQQDGGTEDASV